MKGEITNCKWFSPLNQLIQITYVLALDTIFYFLFIQINKFKNKNKMFKKAKHSITFRKYRRCPR